MTALIGPWVALYQAPALILLMSPSQRQSAELFPRSCSCTASSKDSRASIQGRKRLGLPPHFAGTTSG
jgi:hypothetical protein